ncbi:hypothetical protein SAMD00023353_1801080 [Rosellinia necatrix]|uniref:Uncharacterized protein n=1 Tax=Rosellinia necatrix TaxID=77044 RepID=A0A1W2TE61_ROSNE|nr:hypothetical protein SAMD00023353_1801080 [Rosellinia necatrix]
MGFSRSPPPHGRSHLPPSYPTLCSPSFTGPRRVCSPPPCTSPLLDYQQPISASPPYGYAGSSYTGNRPHGFQYAEQRRNSTGTVPALHPCARILNIELEKPKKRSSTATSLLEKVSRYPLEYPEPIPYSQLLRMFQQLYGNMLDSIELITRDLLRVEDPAGISCKATICRFDKRDTWRVFKSRPGVNDRFYCAPHIEITLPYLPPQKVAKEIIEAISDSCDIHVKHMRPAYKFKTKTYSWKFEPGMVYESVDAEHLMAKPVVDEQNRAGTDGDEERQGAEPNGTLVPYTNEKTEEGSSKPNSGDATRKLDHIKEELRFSPNKNQCKEIVKVLLAGEFRLDPRRITVWFWAKDVELSDGKWYPWGSLDNTYGLVLACKQVVQYDPEDAKRSAARAAQLNNSPEEKEPRDIAPTVRVILPAERTDFAKDDENVKGLKECVERIRAQLAIVSTFHSQAAFCISWKKERREFADWISPQVVYRPMGNGDNYVAETVEGQKR